MPKKDLQDIKQDFLAALESSSSKKDTLETLSTAAGELRGSYGLTLHEACTQLTAWAIEDGYIPEEAGPEAEQQAEEAIRQQAAE